MTDANIVSIAITLFAIAAGSLFNNVRITDTAAALNKRIDDSNAATSKRFDDLIRLMESRFNTTDQKLDRIADTLTA
jgi:hypothetical protein